MPNPFGLVGDLKSFWGQVANTAKNYGSVPPPPPKPLAPPVGKELKNNSLDLFHPFGGPDTVAQIGGIVNAETQGMRDSGNENEPLAKAREKIAHVRLNGIRRFGGRVQSERWMDPPKMSGPDYPASLDAARRAVRDHFTGIDPTRGATSYNMRTSSQSARGGPRWRARPHTKSGPYLSSTQYNWIWTYE